MSALVLQDWLARRAAALDEIEHAHRSVGGTGPGRRYLTQQINQAMDPSIKNPQAALNPGPFAEGDRVCLLWGVTPVEGIVVEDRGNLGLGGRRLYRVRVQLDDVSEPMETEEPAEDLTLVAKGPIKSRNGRRHNAGV